jgi:hypothetical protein
MPSSWLFGMCPATPACVLACEMNACAVCLCDSGQGGLVNHGVHAGSLPSELHACAAHLHA